MHVFPRKAHPIDKFKGAHFLKAKWAWQTYCSHLTMHSACHHPYSEHRSEDWAEWSSTGTTTERRRKLHADGVEPVQVQQAPVSATLMGAPLVCFATDVPRIALHQEPEGKGSASCSSMDRLGNSSQASLSLCLLSVNKWLILLSTSPDRSENPVLQISKSIW